MQLNVPRSELVLSVVLRREIGLALGSILPWKGLGLNEYEVVIEYLIVVLGAENVEERAAGGGNLGLV